MTLSPKTRGRLARITLLLGLPLLGLTLFGLQGCKEKAYIHVGPNWDAISRLDPGGSGFAVTGHVQTPVKLGEPIRLEINSEKPGRLWIISVDRRDELSVVFPNARATDNAIAANETRLIPPADADWVIEAVEPVGENLVAFLVTDDDVDLDDIIARAPPESSGDKALRVVSDERYWGIATQVLEVLEP